MLVHAITFAAMGVSPTFALLVVVVLFLSIPGSLWHLPASAAISQRFPERRGFAISMHGFGSNIGNVSGPVLAGALLATGFLIWRDVYFIYGGLALLMAVFVWWSLRGLGRETASGGGSSLSGQFGSALSLLKNPIVMALISAALLRGIGLSALFNWTPFYLRNDLEMSALEAGRLLRFAHRHGYSVGADFGLVVRQMGAEGGAGARVCRCRFAVHGGGWCGRQPAADTHIGRPGPLQLRSAPDHSGFGAGTTWDRVLRPRPSDCFLASTA